ncbi:hypothetical protein [Paraburkholderia bannensis]|uniref:hypothetical protein n=1 Tax=Paraburkholderia bannensis TaxID=765414 RepID=UPI002AB63A85|nr:hypothetical protein [Paraburkholderia bannensis]
MNVQTAEPTAIRNTARSGTGTAIVALIAVVIALIVVCSTIYGTYKFFSPVPFWDQWDGNIGFYQQIREGMGWHAFWAQHMEHRIVMSRLLFLADIAWFGGLNAFLVICNLLLCLGVATVLVWEARRSRGTPVILASAFAITLMFCWSQKENLTWGFQSQCILVYLFALLAFARLSREDHRGMNLGLAVLLSVLATISMGNGVAAFVVGAVQCFLMRQSWKRIVVLLVAGAVSAAIYFHNYTKPVLPLIGEAPKSVLGAKILYAFAFLGNPTYYATLGWPHSYRYSIAVGLITFLFVAVTLVRIYLARTVTSYRGFLIGTYGFVVVSAIGAANSRWMLGPTTATAGRYTTPALVGLVVVGLLLLDVTKHRKQVLSMIGVTAFAAFMALSNRAVKDDNSILFNWKLAVLSQKIGLDHPEYEGQIYPLDHGPIFGQRATTANQYQIGIYGSGWLHDAGLVKFDPSRVDAELCTGYLDSIKQDSVGQTASGWLVVKKYAQPSTLVLLVDGTGKTVGYGVTGQQRPDVQKAVPGATRESGWLGFMERGAQGVRPYAFVAGKFCPFGTPLN